MVTETYCRRVLRTGGAVGAAIFLLSTTAQADVSGAVCNTEAGSGAYTTAVIVWVDGERTEVKVGERGLTQNIVFSDQGLIDWMRQEFAGGSADEAVGFNDCAGSQLQPQRSPVSNDSGDGQSNPGLIAPPTEAPPIDTSPPQNDYISVGGGYDDETIVGVSWDNLLT